MEHIPCSGIDHVCLDFPRLLKAELRERANRFRVQIRIGAELTSAYLANPGRLEELMTPGRTVWVVPATHPHRKTPYDLTLIEYAGTLVSLNSHLRTRLLHTALSARALPWFAPYPTVRGAVPLGDSRIDFRLSDDQGQVCWLEAKSVTLVEDGVARFPDAVTARGSKHLQELARLVSEGHRAVIFYVIQRMDAGVFEPADRVDPASGRLLRQVAGRGVELAAWDVDIDLKRIRLRRAVPLRL